MAPTTGSNREYPEGRTNCPDDRSNGQNPQVTQACHNFEQAAYTTGCSLPPCPFAVSADLDPTNTFVNFQRYTDCMDMVAAVSSCTELGAVVDTCRICE